jgi:diacylglycerol kinase (ATP)
MPRENNLKFLFVINPASGTNNTAWANVISEYFAGLSHTIELLELQEDFEAQAIINKIDAFKPDKVVAVGGDGTIKLVAECLLQKDIPLGILPAGSANGLAKELGISDVPQEALDILLTGEIKKIHLTKVNGHLCIHLSDIGFNAYVIKKFETQQGRGMWGYLKAAVKVLFDNPVMDVEILMDGKYSKMKAAMIVIANGTKYGSGALINPVGKLDDELFEIVVVKKISLPEIFKMTVSHSAYHPEKTVVFQSNSIKIRALRRVHFQVDGEYLGKVNEINASLIKDALEIIVPLG